MKDIKGYEGLYAVTEDGQVWSYRNNKFLAWQKTKNHYFVTLYYNCYSKHCYIHRLVAEAYIDNPMNLPLINHKDENPKNNSISNLEWCDAKYNINYGTGIERAKQKRMKKVRCLETGIIYCSAKQASIDTNINHSNIVQVCKGNRITAGGFHWEYEE